MANHRIIISDRKYTLEGKIVCIRPVHPLEVDRIERDVTKLEDLYEEGFEQGELFCQQHWDKR